jgi:hypothetical protein
MKEILPEAPLPVTVAVSVTGCPNCEGLGVTVSDVDVGVTIVVGSVAALTAPLKDTVT